MSCVKILALRKHYLVFFFASILLFGCSKSKKEVGNLIQADSVAIISEVKTSSVLETIVSDLNSDGRVDTCFIMIPPNDGEAGEFRKIYVTLNGSTKTQIGTEDFWNPVDSSFLVVNKKNAVNSKRVYAYKDRDKMFLLLFGYPYGTGRRFQIALIDGLNISTVFNDEFDDIVFFGKVKNENVLTLIVRNSPELYSMIDSLNADIGTYSPFLVYKYRGSFVLDEAASEVYNKEHYIWKGIKYDADQKVLYPRNDERPKFID